jgi:hypothetical protein
MIEIEYEFRQEDLIHFNEMCIKKNQALQNDIRNHRFLILGILLFVSIFYYLYYNDMQMPAYIIGFGLLWIFVFKPYEMKMDMRRQILAKYTEAEKKSLFGIHQLLIDPQYLIEKSPAGKHKTAWKDLVRVEYGEAYVYIYTDLNSAIIIPVETVKKGELEKFSEQAEILIDRSES